MLRSFLSEIKDTRRKEGRRYEPGYILLFPIFAILSGADLITDKKMGGCPRSYKSGKEKRDIRYKKEVMGKYR